MYTRIILLLTCLFQSYSFSVEAEKALITGIPFSGVEYVAEVLSSKTHRPATPIAQTPVSKLRSHHLYEFPHQWSLRHIVYQKRKVDNHTVKHKKFLVTRNLRDVLVSAFLAVEKNPKFLRTLFDSRARYRPTKEEWDMLLDEEKIELILSFSTFRIDIRALLHKYDRYAEGAMIVKYEDLISSSADDHSLLIEPFCEIFSRLSTTVPNNYVSFLEEAFQKTVYSKIDGVSSTRETLFTEEVEEYFKEHQWYALNKMLGYES